MNRLSFLHKKTDLTKGSITKGIIAFILPLFLGSLLQQLYNVADAWVVGNFADNNAFAGVSSLGSLIFLVIGFCNGLAIGGGVIISRYFGAKDSENISKAIHTNVLMGLIASVIATLAGVFFAPQLLKLMNVPDEVMEYSLTYLQIFFGGAITTVMYNIFMSIMRALGDSVHPLYYLMVSSFTNIILDILFVAVFKWGVAGAAIATVISQGLSVVLCLFRMLRTSNEYHLEFKKLKIDKLMMLDVLKQGIPTGIQNSVISIGNVVIQSNFNTFGSFAMAGHGAYTKLEGFAFLPITCMAMTLPTFVSQNIGAGEYKRAKTGALKGIIIGLIMAEITGIAIVLFGKPLLRIFISEEAAFTYGLIDIAISPVFYFLLAFSHCAAGVLRGLQKSTVPMFGMLISWCIIRTIYVTTALSIKHEYSLIMWAYPITWTITTVIFLVFLLKVDWNNPLNRVFFKNRFKKPQKLRDIK